MGYWPDVLLKGDINKIVAEDIPDADLWCGGFPCQDLSLANQGKRKGFEGEWQEKLISRNILLSESYTTFL